jgi:hypothetical protein
VATGSATVATVGETIKSWSVMEMLICVVGLAGVLILHLMT